jgi:hypothetical protein
MVLSFPVSLTQRWSVHGEIQVIYTPLRQHTSRRCRKNKIKVKKEEKKNWESPRWENPFAKHGMMADTFH